jgi:heme-degrading monooxygenase HmoA
MQAIDAPCHASRRLSCIVEFATAVIIAFEVPPDADADFTAAWERTHTATISGTTLHRALREDVGLRFVAVGPAHEPDPTPFKSHAGVYEVVRVDGRPDVTGGVVLINPFDVPTDDDERFLAGWDRARTVLAQQQGYVGTRLHRSLTPADFRFVNMARWSSPLMFARAQASRVPGGGRRDAVPVAPRALHARVTVQVASAARRAPRARSHSASSAASPRIAASSGVRLSWPIQLMSAPLSRRRCAASRCPP